MAVTRRPIWMRTAPAYLAPPPPEPPRLGGDAAIAAQVRVVALVSSAIIGLP